MVPIFVWELHFWRKSSFHHILNECSTVSWISDIFDKANQCFEHMKWLYFFEKKGIPLELHRVKLLK